jgi:hypothetical protein
VLAAGELQVEASEAAGHAVDSIVPREEPVLAARAVPAGRIPFDLGASAVLCYTVVSDDAVDVLSRTGSVRPERVLFDGGDEFDDSFVAAYDWMRWQMHRHIHGYTGGFPIWVWARIGRRDLVSTVNEMAAQNAGSTLVELRIPREQLLLTDYLTWHDVLNGSPAIPVVCVGCGTLHCDDASCLDGWFDDWYDRWSTDVPRDEDGAKLPWWCWPPPMQARLFDGWDTIRSLRPGWTVQGCVERIRGEWVQAIHPLRVTTRRQVGA